MPHHFIGMVCYAFWSTGSLVLLAGVLCLLECEEHRAMHVIVDRAMRLCICHHAFQFQHAIRFDRSSVELPREEG
jgi:hypothetical protein